MKLKLDLPIKIGQELRRIIIDNFSIIQNEYKEFKDKFNKHKSDEQNAHDAKQIKYRLTTVDSELQYQKGLINGLTLGHNGDGINELKQAHIALDGTDHDLLAPRIKYDLEVIKDEEQRKHQYLIDYISYYTNLKSIGGVGDGETDNTELFDTLDPYTIYYVPQGIYKTTKFPVGMFFGKGELLVNDETVPLDNKIAQQVLVDTGTTNSERYYNFIAGQQAGRNMNKYSYGNTGVGYAVFRKNIQGKRMTAFGKGALSNITNGYSNDAFGADALGQGTFGQRNTGIGANALKWGGATDAIATLHDFWKDKGALNFINSYFVPRFPNVWQFLGDENTPNDNLYPKKEKDYRENIGVGRNALVHAMKSIGNVAVGYNSQAHTIKGDENTSMGNRALRDNLLGNRNTAIGSYASVNNITGEDNVALGGNALQQTLHAGNNTAVGYGSMHFFKDDENKNTEDTYTHGYRNTAIGTQTMQDGKNASYSTFVGSYAGRYVEGNFNVGVGASSLYNLVKGERNVAVGGNTLKNTVSGNDNVAIGYTSGPNGDYEKTVSLGANAHANGDNQVQLGSDDATVYTFGDIKQRSDERNKTSIRTTKFGLDFIKHLKPVDFKYYNSNSDRFHHGVIAQDLEKLKDIGYDFGGLDNPKYNGGEDVYSVGYTELIAPIIKGLQELTVEVESLRRENQYFKAKIDGGAK